MNGRSTRPLPETNFAVVGVFTNNFHGYSLVLSITVAVLELAGAPPAMEKELHPDGFIYVPYASMGINVISRPVKFILFAKD